MSSRNDRISASRRLDSLTASRLTDLARVAAGEAKLEVASWDVEPVYGGFGSAVGGTSLYRFKIRTASKETISLVLKILFERKGEEARSPYYWKREYEVYRSSILAELPANSFSTPRIFDLQDFGNSCWIWMEDIEDIKGAWTLSDFDDIAQRLGRFNGAWMTAKPLPDYDWLTANWHSAIVPALAPAFHDLDSLLESPLARTALPYKAKDEIAAIWNDRHLFQKALRQLPRALCHTDAFRRNILRRKHDVALLDWALASIGGIGEELVCLVAVSLYYEGFSAEFADRLDKTVFAGYIEGLRQAGWAGDAKLARIGYTCAMVLRGLAGVKQDLELLEDEANYELLFRTHHTTNLTEIARLFADVRSFRLLKMAREASRLLSA
ncbi:MAG: phosphotransferase [Chloroflexi bacterium]|nr:phosphotransferase [Chloroflexota bacterium]